MANYIATDTDLGAVADAIRTKGGASGPLEFPDEFVSAIGNISTVNNQNKSRSYTPTETAQSETVTADSGYTGLGQVSVSVGAIDSNYVGSGITRRSSSDMTASGATVTSPAGYYSSSASKSVTSGTAGTPTASKGTVSNHSVSVTPSVTNTTGYITGGTKTGTAVNVTASELVSGTINISSAGNTNVTNYATASVAAGSATTPTTSITANPTLFVSNTGLVSAAVSKSQNITPTVNAGWVSSGTAGSVSIDGLATQQLSTQAATTFHPSTTDQTIASGKYTTGTQTFKAVTTTNLSAENIVSGVTVKVGDSTDDDCVASVTGTAQGGTLSGLVWQDNEGYIHFDDEGGDMYITTPLNVTTNGTYTAPTGVAYTPVSVQVSSSPTLQAKTNISPTTSSQTITPDSGYDGLSSVQINAMPSGTAGTPTATKGTVSNHAVTVTPSVTNTTGYITGSTKTGTGVQVTASELASGNKAITENGTNIDVVGYSTVSVNVSGGATYTATIVSSDVTDASLCRATYNNIIYYAQGATFTFSENDTVQLILEYGAVSVDGTVVASDPWDAIFYRYTLPAHDIEITLSQRNNSIDVDFPTLSITQNGKHNVSDYYYADVNVSGGGAAVQKQINFIDYDGTIVASYTASEWANASALPSNPSHTGLVAQGWNWTKAQIDAQLTALPNGDIWVGQMYITQSGDTEIDVSMPDGRLSPILTICVNGTVRVDWGDGYYSTVTGTSLNTRLEAPHTYASAGNYTISIHVVSGTFTFNCGSSYLILRKNTTTNDNRVYANCVQKIRLGSGITSLGNYAFSYCCSLKSISIPDGVNISNNAFYYCYSLKSITIPDDDTSIGSSACHSCYSLASVAIPKTVTNIGASAFYYCSSLQSICIPNSVTTINSSVFNGCSSLKSIAIPDSVTSTGSSWFNNCFSLVSLTFSKNLTSLGDYMICNCYSLADVTIPNNVTSLGRSSFASCYSLTSITVPSGVTSIGNNAFSYACGVSEYHILPTVPPTLGTYVFDNIVSDCTIYVPSASLTDYQTTTGWSEYASYMVGE